MSDIELTQIEADALIATPKVKIDSIETNYPDPGGSIIIPLVSEDRRDNFFLDISRGRIDLRKGKYQSRAHHVVVLLRLDFGGAPHQNPDGNVISCPHLHVYKEGYGDKWAIPAPADSFSDTTALWRTLEEFMDFCNVTERPNIEKGLLV